MSSPVAQPLLELERVSRHYALAAGTVRALDEVSLRVWPGEFIAIMGASGSGKSTLMNILGCLDTPTSGSYQVQGQDVSSLSSDERAALRGSTFGFVFQRYNLLSTASAEENVEIPAIYAGQPRDERRMRVRALLAQLGLEGRGDHRPGALSGGQQQRVAIARALVNDPPVILADEPTGALDSRSGAEVMALLKGLNQQGRTIILITHDPTVAAHAERQLLIQDGVLSEPAPAPTSMPVPTQGVVAAAVPPRPAGAPAARVVRLGASLRESVKMAFRSLRVNLFRTLLTLLGIVIGVASVVTLLALGTGSKERVVQEISAMGTNLLSARPGAPGIRGGGDIVTMTPWDAEAMLELPNVAAVLPERGMRFSVRYGNVDFSTTIQGTWPGMPGVRNWMLQDGAFFTQADLDSYAAVAVLGTTALKSLFPEGSDPIGRYVLIRNVPFEVIGVLTSKGASMFGSDQDDVIYIPLTTGFIRLFGKPYVNSISIQVADVASIDETETAVSALLTARHRAEDFSIRNSAQILDMVSATQNTLTILLAAVAALSLLVGGIGVMNIMLVSVTERTREIGVRMATGARMRDILVQFNTEAAVVGVFGGLLGLILGVVVGMALQGFGVDVIFTVPPAIAAFGSALVTGLVFGYLPARKAARLDPVQALASE
jgi:macrolide transport system ATP-binding/permease protein